MNEKNVQADESITAQCITCREKLEDGATKCVSCGEWQNWRRFLFFGNTTLTLIIALISVISLSFERLQDLISLSSDADISAEAIFVSEDEVRLWVANAGGGVAVPTKVRFEFIPQGEEFVWGAHEIPQLDLYANETVQLDARSADTLSFETPANGVVIGMKPDRAFVFRNVFGRSQFCLGELHYLLVGGEPGSASFEVKCNDLMSFILSPRR